MIEHVNSQSVAQQAAIDDYVTKRHSAAQAAAALNSATAHLATLRGTLAAAIHAQQAARLLYITANSRVQLARGILLRDYYMAASDIATLGSE